MCLSHFAASRRSHPVPWDTLTCRQTRYHLIVSGTDQTVWAEMWQRLPLLLGSSSKNRLCFLDFFGIVKTYRGLDIQFEIFWNVSEAHPPDASANDLAYEDGQNITESRNILGFHIFFILFWGLELKDGDLCTMEGLTQKSLVTIQNSQMTSNTFKCRKSGTTFKWYCRRHWHQSIL